LRFSVIIATCGRWERLAITLDRVQAAVARHGVGNEIIVVDNSPADVCGLRSAVCGLPVRWVRSRPLSKCAALNVGIEAATNDWLAFTDDDCLPDEHWLCAAEAFAVKRGLRCFGGRVSPLMGEGLPRWLQVGKRNLMPTHGSIVRYEPAMDSGGVPHGQRKPLGANFFAHKAVFREHGGYDEALWDRCGKAAIGCDDGEMMLRMDRLGEPVGYCAEAVVLHPVYAERATLSNHLRAAFRLGYREPILNGMPDTWRWIIRLLFKNLAKTIRCSAAGDYAAAVYYGEQAAVMWGVLMCRIRRLKPL